MNWEALTAICAVVTLIGLFGLFLVNAVIRSAFNDFKGDIRKEFATKDQLRLVEQRVDSFEHSRFRRSHGD